MYALVNLDTYVIDKQTNEKYHEINKNTLNRKNIKDVHTDIYDTQIGNRVKGRAYDLNHHYNGGTENFGLQLQNLGLFGSLAGAIGEGAKLGGSIWEAADKKSYDKMGGKIMGGVGAGADAFGDIDKKHHLGKKMFGKKDDDWDFMNLEATHAIIATPEQAEALINLNSQLENPYEIKGAFLI